MNFKDVAKQQISNFLLQKKQAEQEKNASKSSSAIKSNHNRYKSQGTNSNANENSRVLNTSTNQKPAQKTDQISLLELSKTSNYNGQPSHASDLNSPIFADRTPNNIDKELLQNLLEEHEAVGVCKTPVQKDFTERMDKLLDLQDQISTLQKSFIEEKYEGEDAGYDSDFGTVEY